MTQWQMINKSEMNPPPPKLQCIWIDKSFLHTYLKIQIYGVLDTNSPHVFQSILFWCVTYVSPLIARSITEAQKLQMKYLLLGRLIIWYSNEHETLFTIEVFQRKVLSDFFPFFPPFFWLSSTMSELSGHQMCLAEQW